MSPFGKNDERRDSRFAPVRKDSCLRYQASGRGKLSRHDRRDTTKDGSDMPKPSSTSFGSRWLRRTAFSSLALTGSLVIGLTAASSAQDAPTTESARVTASDSSMAGDFFGLSVAVDGDTMVVGTPNDGTFNNGAAYVFVGSGDAWVQQAKLIADGPSPNDDLFGTSVAIDGDTILIGAPIANGGQPRSGAAYVFTRAGTDWEQQDRVTPADVTAGINFGTAVAIDGDRFVAGAPLANDTIDTGSAYVFARSGTDWVQQGKLVPTDGQANDRFGSSVSIDGSTVAAGAPNADLDASNTGAAYVFTETAGAWTQQGKLTASDAEASDNLGRSVSVDGDVVVAGAPNADSTTIAAEPGTMEDPGFDSGVAYVFARSGTNWSEQAILVASDEAGTDAFGSGVAVEANTIVVGSSGDSVGFGSAEGSAFVFVNEGDGWVEEDKLVASDGAGSDQLGISVALSGGIVAAGAPNVDIDIDNQDSGAAYVFDIDAPVEVELPDEFVPEEVIFYADDDGDTFGDPNTETVAFTSQENGEVVQPAVPAGFVSNRTDCNDADDTVFPGATDLPGDGIDQDCNGEDAPVPPIEEPPAEEPPAEEPPAEEPPVASDLFCNNQVVTVNLALGQVPTDGDDVILGTEGPDVINAGDGRDTICAGAGDDIINAGDGADMVFGGSGDDTITAGQGKDTVYAQGGDDFVSGGKGKDTLIGGRGNDDLRGNEGTDTIDGGAGDDVLRGGQKADSIMGGSGNDALFGGIIRDVLDGGTGLDTYNGGAGLDTCVADPNGLTEQTTKCEI